MGKCFDCTEEHLARAEAKIYKQKETIGRLKAALEDLKLAAWTFETSSGCGCCADDHLQFESKKVLQSLGADLVPFKDSEKEEYLTQRKAHIARFKELRKSLNIPSYEMEFYGEEEDD